MHLSLFLLAEFSETNETVNLTQSYTNNDQVFVIKRALEEKGKIKDISYLSPRDLVRSRKNSTALLSRAHRSHLLAAASSGVESIRSGGTVLAEHVSKSLAIRVRGCRRYSGGAAPEKA